MKSKIITLFLALVAIVGSISASFTQVDGIYYDLDPNTLTASVTYGGDYPGYDAAGYSGNITIPDSINHFSGSGTFAVTSIGEDAFRYCENLLSVKIPNTVTTIRENAFRECLNLWCFTLGENVTEIGDYAFCGTALSTIISYASEPPSLGFGTFCFPMSWYYLAHRGVYVQNQTAKCKYEASWGPSWEGWPSYDDDIPLASYTIYTIGNMPVTSCSEAATAALSVSENNATFNNDATYTIAGYVTEISNTWANGMMSFWMADAANGGRVILAYKCAIEDSNNAVRIGDYVAVSGKLTKYYSTPEFAQGCTVYRTEYTTETGPSTTSDRYVVLAKRGASSNWYYMTSDLGTASTKRYQAVNTGTNVLANVNNANLEDIYYWQIDGNKLRTAAGYSTWTSGNSATLNAIGQELTIKQQSDGTYTFSFNDGTSTRYLSLNATAGNDYFAYYKGTNQIYQLTLVKEGESGLNADIKVPSTQEPQSGTKILRDGHIYIIRGEKIYTLQGQEVK